MLVDCAHYKDGARQDDEPLAIEEAAARRSDDDGFVWLGLHDPTPEELLEAGRQFDLPALAVEDAMQQHQRPKIEDYDHGYFLVLHTARYIDAREEVEFGEVHVFTGPGYVIVVRHGAASELHSARERLEQAPALLRLGPTAAVWAVMDKVVDDYQPVVEGIENDVEEVEEAVFAERGDQTKRVYFLRRELVLFHRAVHPLIAALDVLEARSRTDVPKVLRNHLRDVEDHVRRVEEEIATQRDVLTSIFQANLAVIGLQQNDAVRKISGWAAVIAVPTFMASIWGMNFKHMPELSSRLGYPLALALMVLTGLGLFSVLRRARWL
ncbi:MAG: magnesium and cobalt transport protein CorA [Solirubrobacterales bacterium]|nr:magnesium and cobalt transport protein CorA [Solirubrobacterales bacterium]